MFSVRILIAPDKFAGTLTAAEAAGAIAAGWRRWSPGDEPDVAPLADGGPGFVDAAHSALGGDLVSATVTGPLGVPTPAAFLLAGDTAYVEAAQACGLALVAPEARDAGAATTFGVGELVAAAADAGARRIVVGLGGSATNDGGAGLLAALGARPADQLRRGGRALAGLTSVDIGPSRARLAGRTLVAATDVDNPLTGPQGATRVFAAQKGADKGEIEQLDAALSRWAELAGLDQAALPGAGAAGGLGYALLLLGAARVSGATLLIDMLRLGDRIARADLVITGEGAFDGQSLRGKVVSAVARAAQERARPTIVLAGRVEVGGREMAATGVEAAYAVVDDAGSVEAALDRPAQRLAALAARVARTWSR
jgi:glycerate kinase